jgi:polyferredoxin
VATPGAAIGSTENRIIGAAASSKLLPHKPKKKLIRRAQRDYSQPLRHGFQFAFLLLNVWIGGEFYLWVRHFVAAGTGAAPARPAGVDGWLPISGLMSLKYWVLTGHILAIHPAALFLLVAFSGIAFLFRKAFCSWLCPVGTISEYLWQAGHKLLGRNIRPPRWLDVSLRGLKYLLLGFFLWAVSMMRPDAIRGFMYSPFGIIADVKMLNFFLALSATAVLILAVLVLGSFFIQNFWCRYLCPYGGLLGLVSLFSPMRIRRNVETCIDCAKCAKACPSFLPVDQLVTIRSAECTGCMECVAVCPAEGALDMSLPRAFGLTKKQRRMPVWALAAGIALIFLGIVGFAKTAGYWQSRVPESTYQQLVPHADQATHPGE